MSKVFLVEEPKNVKPEAAAEFGEITMAFEIGHRRPSVFQCEEFGAAFIASLEKHGYDPDKDYFCLTGGLIPVSNALTALLREYGEIKVLLFVSTENKYVERVFSVEETVCDKK